MINIKLFCCVSFFAVLAVTINAHTGKEKWGHEEKSHSSINISFQPVLDTCSSKMTPITSVIPSMMPSPLWTTPLPSFTAGAARRIPSVLTWLRSVRTMSAAPSGGSGPSSQRWWPPSSSRASAASAAASAPASRTASAAAADRGMGESISRKYLLY